MNPKKNPPDPGLAKPRQNKPFGLAIREQPLAFWEMPDIRKARCICCDKQTSHISAYPFFSSALFARQIVLWCGNCGFGMVPETSFELDDYYRDEYAVDNRGDREADPEQYFARMDSDTPPGNLARYRNRARTQISRIRKRMPDIGAMLDIGSGPGYALRTAGARESFALEHDRYSRPFLDHIGARIVDWDTVGDFRYDVILLSHSLEHFQYGDVLPRLTKLVDRLNPGGIFYIEVPPGGLGWKTYHYKHEPHTLFFTPESLHNIGRKLDLELLLCRPLNKTYNKIEDRADTIYNPPKDSAFDNPRGCLTLIARKPSVSSIAGTGGNRNKVRQQEIRSISAPPAEPRSKTLIVTIVTDNFLTLGMVWLAALKKNTPNLDDFDVVMLHDDTYAPLSKANRDRLRFVYGNVIFHSPGSDFLSDEIIAARPGVKTADAKVPSKKAAFLKLSILKYDQYDTVIWLDADTMTRAPIDVLFDIEGRKNPRETIAAVSGGKSLGEQRTRTLVRGHFNAGVMLFGGDLLGEERFALALEELAKGRTSHLRDQPIFNAVFRPFPKIYMPDAYNFKVHTDDEELMQAAYEQAKIVHFIGGARFRLLVEDEYRKYPLIAEYHGYRDEYDIPLEIGR